MSDYSPANDPFSYPKERNMNCAEEPCMCLQSILLHAPKLFIVNFITFFALVGIETCAANVGPSIIVSIIANIEGS